MGQVICCDVFYLEIFRSCDRGAGNKRHEDEEEKGSDVSILILVDYVLDVRMCVINMIQCEWREVYKFRRSKLKYTYVRTIDTHENYFTRQGLTKIHGRGS